MFFLLLPKNIDHLAYLGVPSENRIDLAQCRLVGEIRAILVDKGTALPAVRFTPGFLDLGPVYLDGALGYSPEIGGQRIAADRLNKVGIPAGCEKGRFGEKCQEYGPGTHLFFFEINGRDKPGVLDKFKKKRGKDRFCGIAGLEIFKRRLDRPGDLCRIGIEPRK